MARVYVWGRWFVWTIATFAWLYPLNVDEVVYAPNAALAILLLATNGYLHYRLATERTVSWRWMLALSALDLVLRQAYHRGEAADFAAEAERLRREATYHLRDRPMSDADNWRLQNELGWHHDRGNLLRFLDDPSIEPTNNRAERALRPAVIARKVSHCSKNVGGADAFSAFTSIIRTLARNGGDHSLVNGLCGVFSGAPVPTPSF